MSRGARGKIIGVTVSVLLTGVLSGCSRAGLIAVVTADRPVRVDEPASIKLQPKHLPSGVTIRAFAALGRCEPQEFTGTETDYVPSAAGADQLRFEAWFENRPIAETTVAVDVAPRSDGDEEAAPRDPGVVVIERPNADREPTFTDPPRIWFTTVPPKDRYGGSNQTSTVVGEFSSGSLSGLRVVLLSRTVTGWYVQDRAGESLAELSPGGSWSAEIYLGSQYAALLVLPDFALNSLARPCSNLPPVGGNVVAKAVVDGKEESPSAP